VWGTVADEEGTPIEDVLIRIEGMESTRKYQVETNSKGEYQHTTITRQGTYRVIAVKDGYQTSYIENLRAGVDRSDGAGRVDFILKIGRAGRLVFEMTDEEIETATVSAEEAEKFAESAEEVRLNLDQGLELYNQGQYEQALEIFNAAAALDEKQPTLWANVGNAYSKLNQHEQAIVAYDKAILLAPEDPTLYQNMGGIYGAMGNTAKAQELYEKAVGLSAYGDPKDAAVNYYNMGVTFINSGQTAEAVEALTKALQADPDHAEAHYQLGISLLGNNDMEGCMEHLNSYLELSPNGPNVEAAKSLIEMLGP
jgi:Flp pilus assembly protein TadD